MKLLLGLALSSFKHHPRGRMRNFLVIVSTVRYIRGTILPELPRRLNTLCFPRPLDPFVGFDVPFCLELAREVAVRSTYKGTGAPNPALVFMCDLVKGSNSTRYFEMYALPNRTGSNGETVDSTEPVLLQISTSSFTNVDPNEPTSASAPFSSDVSRTRVDGDGENIDDQRLAMPLGPASRGTG